MARPLPPPPSLNGLIISRGSFFAASQSMSLNIRIHSVKVLLQAQINMIIAIGSIIGTLIALFIYDFVNLRY